MNRDYIVLQVRLGSTRLPGKLLYKLSGITIFDHIIKRLLSVKLPKGIIVATTRNTIDKIIDIIKKYQIEFFVGPEEDVLKRYALAVKKFKINNVIRATGDNPLVCIDYIDRAVKLHYRENADLTTFPDLPYGTGIEVVKSSALLMADREAKDLFEREHITQYVYHHPEKFKIVKAIPEERFRLPELRLTVDTIDDFKFMEEIYNALWRGRPISLEEVIEYLKGKNMLKRSGSEPR